jgi:hypothetical protein
MCGKLSKQHSESAAIPFRVKYSLELAWQTEEFHQPRFGNPIAPCQPGWVPSRFVIREKLEWMALY